MKITRSNAQPSRKGPAENFTGSVRVDTPFRATEPARAGGAFVTFEPGARTAWHTHPLGQTLIVTMGCGWVQSRRRAEGRDTAGRRGVVSARRQTLAWRHGNSGNDPHRHFRSARRQDGRLDGEGERRAVQGLRPGRLVPRVRHPRCRRAPPRLSPARRAARAPRPPHRRARGARRPWCRDSAKLRSRPRGAAALKNAVTGTLSAAAKRASRPAETRFVPFSYFCSCWNETPTFSPSAPCESPRSSRSARSFCPIAASSAVARRLTKCRSLSCAQSPVTHPDFNSMFYMILESIFDTLALPLGALLNPEHGGAGFSAGKGRAGAQCSRAPRHSGVLADRPRRGRWHNATNRSAASRHARQIRRSRRSPRSPPRSRSTWMRCSRSRSGGGRVAPILRERLRALCPVVS